MILSGDDTVEPPIDRISLMLNDEDDEDLGIAPLFGGQHPLESTSIADVPGSNDSEAVAEHNQGRTTRFGRKLKLPARYADEFWRVNQAQEWKQFYWKKGFLLKTMCNSFTLYSMIFLLPIVSQLLQNEYIQL